MSIRTNPVTATVDLARGTAPGLRLRMLGAAAAATLVIDAYVHLHDAHFYGSSTALISKGALFQVQAIIAIVIAIALLVRPGRVVWALAVLVTVSAVAAVVLYTYVNVGAVGPLQDMYEPTWQVPGKALSAYFEGTGGLLSAAGLMLAVRSRRGSDFQRAAGGAPPGRTRGVA